MPIAATRSRSSPATRRRSPPTGARSRSSPATRRSTSTRACRAWCSATCPAAGRSTSGAGRTTSEAPPARQFSEPLWLGKEPLAGKTLLIYAEQGLGDTIQFCRYARPLAERGATVLLRVQPPLRAAAAGAGRRRAPLRGGRAAAALRLPLPAAQPAARTRHDAADDSRGRRLHPPCRPALRRAARGLAGQARAQGQAAHRPGLVGQRASQERPQPLDPAAGLRPHGVDAGALRLAAERDPRGRCGGAEGARRHRLVRRASWSISPRRPRSSPSSTW